MIAFIDCFVNAPVNHCINYFTQKSNIPSSYHMPSKYGLDSLKKCPASCYIILGSSSNVDQRLPWHKDLLSFIIPKIESNTPTLGICFGHQLIADYYGSVIENIDSNCSKKEQIRDVCFTKNTFNYKKDETIKLAYAHSQVITKLSDEFETFLESKDFKYEGIKHKKYPFWGVQAHPEASNQFLAEELGMDRDVKVSEVCPDGINFIMSFLKTNFP